MRPRACACANPAAFAGLYDNELYDIKEAALLDLGWVMTF